MADSLQQAQQSLTGGNPVDSGEEKWNQMSESQKKATFDALPPSQTQGKSYYEWLKEGYHKQYETWMPWIEDQYLKWFTKDNKTSYAAKDTLDKSKITGIEQVDNLQDGVNGLVAGQVGQGGLLQPVGDAVSSEGINRAERGGKDEEGRSCTGGVGESVVGGAKSVGGALGGMLGGGK